MAEQTQHVQHPWGAVIRDPVSGYSVELATQPEAIPVIPSGAEFTITWDAAGTAHFTLTSHGT